MVGTYGGKGDPPLRHCLSAFNRPHQFSDAEENESLFPERNWMQTRDRLLNAGSPWEDDFSLAVS